MSFEWFRDLFGSQKKNANNDNANNDNANNDNANSKPSAPNLPNDPTFIIIKNLQAQLEELRASQLESNKKIQQLEEQVAAGHVLPTVQDIATYSCPDLLHSLPLIKIAPKHIVSKIIHGLVDCVDNNNNNLLHIISIDPDLYNVARPYLSNYEINKLKYQKNSHDKNPLDISGGDIFLDWFFTNTQNYHDFFMNSNIYNNSLISYSNNKHCFSHDIYADKALKISIETKKLQYAYQIIQSGNVIDSNIALKQAVELQDTDMVKMLLTFDIDFKTVMSALKKLFNNTDYNKLLVKILYSYIIDHNQLDHFKICTKFIMKGDLEAIQDLINYGKINNAHLQKLLFIAAGSPSSKQNQIITLLIKEGADRNTPDELGKYPKDYAESSGSKSAFKLLDDVQGQSESFVYSNIFINCVFYGTGIIVIATTAVMIALSKIAGRKVIIDKCGIPDKSFPAELINAVVKVTLGATLFKKFWDYRETLMQYFNIYDANKITLDKVKTIADMIAYTQSDPNNFLLQFGLNCPETHATRIHRIEHEGQCWSICQKTPDDNVFI